MTSDAVSAWGKVRLPNRVVMLQGPIARFAIADDADCFAMRIGGRIIASFTGVRYQGGWMCHGRRVPCKVLTSGSWAIAAPNATNATVLLSFELEPDLPETSPRDRYGGFFFFSRSDGTIRPEFRTGTLEEMLEATPSDELTRDLCRWSHKDNGVDDCGVVFIGDDACVWSPAGGRWLRYGSTKGSGLVVDWIARRCYLNGLCIYEGPTSDDGMKVLSTFAAAFATFDLPYIEVP